MMKQRWHNHHRDEREAKLSGDQLVLLWVSRHIGVSQDSWRDSDTAKHTDEAQRTLTVGAERREEDE